MGRGNFTFCYIMVEIYYYYWNSIFYDIMYIAGLKMYRQFIY